MRQVQGEEGKEPKLILQRRHGSEQDKTEGREVGEGKGHDDRKEG